jgi:hypothetical protein
MLKKKIGYVVLSLSSVIILIHSFIYIHTGTADGGKVVKVLCYKSEWSLVRFQMVSLEFFIDIILPIPLRPWGRLSL